MVSIVQWTQGYRSPNPQHTIGESMTIITNAHHYKKKAVALEVPAVVTNARRIPRSEKSKAEPELTAKPLPHLRPTMSGSRQSSPPPAESG